MSSEPESLGAEGPAGPPPTGNEPPARPRRRLWPRLLAGFLGVVLLVAVAGLFIPMSYVIIEPGNATPVEQVVSVKGAPTYPHRGSLLFLTVSVSNGKPNLWRYVAASLDGNAQVISDDDYFGTTTPEQDRKLNVQAMDTSQQTATKVALEKLGYTVTESGKGAMVVEIQ